jgi:hypothetical protein
MTAFHTIWRQWHIPGARNWRTYDVDPGDYHLLDGIEDWIRHSMKLRVMSERNLRRVQQKGGWSNDILVEHLNGEHDDSDTFDEDIYERFTYLGELGEAHRYIPGRWLNEQLDLQGQREPSGSWRVRVHYSTDRSLSAQAEWSLTAQDVVTAPIPLSCVTLSAWDDIAPSWPFTYQTWRHWQHRGTPPEPEGSEPIESQEYGEWGGYSFEARGSISVWVAADSLEEVEADQQLVENALPSAFDPDDFQGPASLSERA